MDINQNDNKNKDLIFTQSLSEIETDYSIELEKQKKVKQTEGLLQAENLFKTDDRDSSAQIEGMNTFNTRVLLGAAGVVLMTVNALTYPRLLKKGRKIMGTKGCEFFNS